MSESLSGGLSRGPGLAVDLNRRQTTCCTQRLLRESQLSEVLLVFSAVLVLSILAHRCTYRSFSTRQTRRSLTNMHTDSLVA